MNPGPSALVASPCGDNPSPPAPEGLARARSSAAAANKSHREICSFLRYSLLVLAGGFVAWRNRSTSTNALALVRLSAVEAVLGFPETIDLFSRIRRCCPNISWFVDIAQSFSHAGKTRSSGRSPDWIRDFHFSFFKFLFLKRFSYRCTCRCRLRFHVYFILAKNGAEDVSTSR